MGRSLFRKGSAWLEFVFMARCIAGPIVRLIFIESSVSLDVQTIDPDAFEVMPTSKFTILVNFPVKKVI
jgi:hypothetical protein